MEKLWLKIPENIREVLKEVWRWIIATLWSIILELVTNPTFISSLNSLPLGTALSLVVKTLIVRFADRVIYLAQGSKASTATKVLTLGK